MQKKSYIRPTVTTTALHSEGLIAASKQTLGLDENNTIDNSNNIYSRQADHAAGNSFWDEDNATFGE